MSQPRDVESDDDYHQNDAAPESPTSSATPAGPSRKWWHVPDTRIEELIQGTLGAAEGDDESPSGSGAGRQKGRPRRGRGGAGHQRSASVGALPSKSKSVHFTAEHEDALDRMLRTTQQKQDEEASQKEGAAELGQEEEEEWDEVEGEERRPRKWWNVPDSKIRDLILKMEASPPQPATMPKTGGTASTCSLQGSISGISATMSGISSSSSAKRRQAEEKINVHVFFIESGDTLTLRVSPDLRLGPAAPPPKNRFTDIFGQGASTKGFDMKVRNFDYKYRQFGSTQRPDWMPEYSSSFKGLIEQLTEIEPSRQRLAHRNHPITVDEKSLRSYGIRDGEFVQLKVHSPWTPGAKRETVLACTKKAKETAVRQKNQQASGHSRSGGYSLRDSKHLRDCKSDGDVWMMPRWISQSLPELFAPVGIGLDGMGGMNLRSDYGDVPIYLPDAHDAKLSRVREVVAGHSQYLRER